MNFEVIETLNPGSNGNTPIVIFGSAGANGSGCINLDTAAVGGTAAKSIAPMSLRLSATPPTESCSVAGGGPNHDLDDSSRYNSHLDDENGDGIQDLRVHVDTPPIGGDSTTTVLYLTGRYDDAGGPLGEACFEAMAPVNISGN